MIDFQRRLLVKKEMESWGNIKLTVLTLLSFVNSSCWLQAIPSFQGAAAFTIVQAERLQLWCCPGKSPAYPTRFRMDVPSA